MNLAVVSAAEWDSELITDLTPECRMLREPQVMGIARPAPADQAGLGGDEFDVILVAYPARLRQSQLALVDANRLRDWIGYCGEGPIRHRRLSFGRRRRKIFRDIFCGTI